MTAPSLSSPKATNTLGAVSAAFRSGMSNRYPPRYAEDFRVPFNDYVEDALRPGVRILEVGGGRRPAIAPADRPPRCRYVGLDVSGEELELAPRGSYDAVVVADVSQQQEMFKEQFDLILSWNTLEHVKSLPSAVTHLRSYLRPSGRFVAQFPGGFSAFAILNRLIPHSTATALMDRLLNRPPDTVFVAHYDHCYYRALVPQLSSFTSWDIYPHYRAAGYFGFSRLTLAPYLAYEEWAYRRQHLNLATHYVVSATR